jgi:hypothetical protein
MIERKRFSVGRAGVWGVLAALSTFGSVGCVSRTLIIGQDDHVNTDMHKHRPCDRRTGEPVEITIVCVYGKDLDADGSPNDELGPKSNVTARDWYERRPQPGDRVDDETGHNRFRLDKDQIYLLTNAPPEKIYGKIIGAALRGGLIDGPKVSRKGVKFDSMALHDGNASIFVFPKFIDRDGSVLSVSPARFNPPGDYDDELYIKIGVNDACSENPQQYISNITREGLGGGKKND